MLEFQFGLFSPVMTLKERSVKKTQNQKQFELERNKLFLESNFDKLCWLLSNH
jgi:hypothetical protein